jgi:hypothetical protein
MLGGIAHQGKDGLDGSAEILMDGDLAQALSIACRLAVFIVDIDQVDVA